MIRILHAYASNFDAIHGYEDMQRCGEVWTAMNPRELSLTSATERHVFASLERMEDRHRLSSSEWHSVWVDELVSYPQAAWIKTRERLVP